MSKYDDYATALVKDVPVEYLKIIINTFMCDAGINMGNDFTDESLERVIQIVSFNFRYLPIYCIGGAFKKGSLGFYGAGRLVPRVIYGWLNEATIEYKKDQDHKKQTEMVDYIHFRELEKYPLGKSICWKIDHVSEEDWDKVQLKSVAEIIGRHGIPRLEDFGIEN